MGNDKPIPKFAKGNKHGGRPALPTVTRIKRRLTVEEFIEEATFLLDLPVHSLMKLVNDPTIPAGRMALARIILHAANDGDHIKLMAVLDRVIGRPKETVHLIEDSGDPVERLTQGRSLEELDERIKHLKQIAEAEPIEIEVRKLDPKEDHDDER